jgi:hypothetical protein
VFRGLGEIIPELEVFGINTLASGVASVAETFGSLSNVG